MTTAPRPDRPREDRLQGPGLVRPRCRTDPASRGPARVGRWRAPVGFKYSAAIDLVDRREAGPTECQRARPNLVRSASRVEVLADELDWPDVVAAVPEHPAEGMVERLHVAVAETSVVGDDPFELERHLGHEAERSAACGLREPHILRLKLGERIGGKTFRSEFGVDRVDEVVAERSEIRHTNARPED